MSMKCKNLPATARWRFWLASGWCKPSETSHLNAQLKAISTSYLISTDLKT
jgi:hypothetical protein